LNTLPPLTIREWSDTEWHASAAVWNALLARSGQDALFLSWEWLTAWWRHFGDSPGFRLRLCAAYRGDALAGIAPLYVQRATRRWFPVRSLQFVGNSWRDDATVASPYQDFIAISEERTAVREAVLGYAADSDAWSELVVNFSSDAPAWENALRRTSIARKFHLRATEHSTSHQADLSSGFDAYLARLGQSTRRSLWHLRRRLDPLGTLRIEHAQPDGLEAAFEHLNRLHELRWGKPAFAGARLRFHLDVARGLSTRGELQMSMIHIDDRVVSVLYDVRKTASQYNLKVAFDPAVERQFSLGLIHFGFALEAAAQSGVTRYDFLAGPGQQTDFKTHLAQKRQELATVQVLTGAILPRLYRWHGAIKAEAK
jgi:CelD/BcsL family acetyltransferase involved in cellulose biosynthesis